MLTAFSTVTGSVAWQVQVPQCPDPGCAITVAAWAGRILVWSQGTVSVIDGRTGTVRATVFPPISAITADARRQTVYGIGAGEVFRIDPETGATLGSRHVGTCARGDVEAAVEPRSGYLYLARSGTLGDRYNMGDPSANPPGWFCGVDPTRGRLLFAHNLGNAVGVTIAGFAPFSHAVIYETIDPFSGYQPVSIADARSGQGVRTLMLTQPVAAADNRNARLYIAGMIRSDLSNARLRVLQGAQLRARTLAAYLPQPSRIAIVPRLHRLVLAFGDSSAVAFLDTATPVQPRAAGRFQSAHRRVVGFQPDLAADNETWQVGAARFIRSLDLTAMCR